MVADPASATEMPRVLRAHRLILLVLVRELCRMIRDGLEKNFFRTFLDARRPTRGEGEGESEVQLVRMRCGPVRTRSRR